MTPQSCPLHKALKFEYCPTCIEEARGLLYRLMKKIQDPEVSAVLHRCYGLLLPIDDASKANVKDLPL